MGPLTGLKVLDLTGMVSGPVAAMMLADQGAEVIKVEPINGELVRHMAAPHNGVNPVFFSCNRGKKSIALDLKSEGGKKSYSNWLLKRIFSCKTSVQVQLKEWVLGKMLLESSMKRLFMSRLVDLETEALTLIQGFTIPSSKRYLEQQTFKQIEKQENQKCFELLLPIK